MKRLATLYHLPYCHFPTHSIYRARERERGRVREREGERERKGERGRERERGFWHTTWQETANKDIAYKLV